ncbi:DNA-directed RNA polymerase II subunit RPB1, partial [Dictyocoela roeselum]
RLNLSATSPYGADFDGDEMNLHMPQSVMAQSELSELLLVSKHIVSPQSNRPVIGIVQDTLLGVRKFTQRDTFLSKRDVMQIVYSTYSEDNKPDPNKIDELLKNPAITRPIVLWTGKQVFSFILPKLNFKGESNGHIPVNEIRKNLKDKKRDIYNNLSKYFPTINISHPFDTQTFIQDGILHTGIIDTKSVGRSQGNLIHIIYNDLGHMECEKFINSLQKIINCWLSTIEGFSIGIGDTIADEDTMKVIVQTIDSAKAEVTKIIRDARGDRLERKPGLTLRETFEANINLALNKARDVSGTSAQKSLKENNNVKQMVLAG